jgi:hypothetical protein
MSATTNVPAAAGAMPSQQDIELIRTVATNVWELVDDFSYDFAAEIHKRVPELGKPDDAEAVEATRTSSVGSMHEFLTIMRAAIFAPNAIETSPEALEHVRFLQSRGVGLAIALRFYHIGIAMFEPVVVAEFERCTSDQSTLERMRVLIRNFIFVYVDQITKRLAAEYGVTEREGFNPDPNAPVWHDPEVVAAARDFLAQKQRGGADGAPRDGRGAARAHSEDALERFCAAMEAAAEDPRLSKTLARAGATIRIELLDDPDLSVTLLLDRTPIEVVDGTTSADVNLSIASVDLDRLCSPDFHLAMAIVRGRVQYEGDVRKFLRVTPVVRHASLPKRAEQTTTPMDD